MSLTSVLTMICVGVGVLFCALGVPLYRGRIRPNPWYGFRTRATLADEEIWYEVNRVSGGDMIVAGVVIVAASAILWLLRARVSEGGIAFTMTAVLLLAVLAMFVRGMLAIRSVETRRSARRSDPGNRVDSGR